MEMKTLINENIEAFKKLFQNDKTFVIREFENANNPDIKFCAIFINDMADLSIINKYIINPLMQFTLEINFKKLDSLDILIKKVVPTGDIEQSSDFNTLFSALTYGNTILLIDGFKAALIINTKNIKERPIDEPPSEKIIRGPREGFTESLGTNLAMIRKRLRTPNLKFIFKQIGDLTKTDVCICYMDNIASMDILNELSKRLDKIKIDGIIDSGYIQEIIKDQKYSAYKTIWNTERPDSVVGKLLEGRIAILSDGSPFALTLPFLFMEYFQISGDYYDHYLYSSINKLIRWIGFVLTISVPSVYLALVTYHQELIPTPLILSIAAARRGVPLPTIIEALLMLFVFEVLREAGTRLPATIGQTISIVGALVIGQAAVEARLISAPMVIVVSLTGITSYLIPKLGGAIALIRVFLLILSTFLGIYGYLTGIILMFLNLFSMRSFGIPYMLNTGSIKLQNQKDMLIRLPWSMQKLRPQLIVQKNSTRIKGDYTGNDSQIGDKNEKG